MKLKNLNQADNFSFGLIALIVLGCLGLLLAVYTPEIKSWRISQADRIINLAGQSSGQQRASLLTQAVIVNDGDPLATEYLAQYYRSVGDYKAVIGAYQGSPSSSNTSYVGSLALIANDYGLAQALFGKAYKQSQSSENLSGLALVDFATDQTADGCNKSAQAKKLNLSSSSADRVGAICEILSGKSTLTPRRQAYLLAESYLYAKALDKLQSIDNKSSGDWMLLSQLYRSIGNKDASIQAINSGLKQDPTNKYLISAKAETLDQSTNSQELQRLKAQLKDLEFSNFQ